MRRILPVLAMASLLLLGAILALSQRNQPSAPLAAALPVDAVRLRYPDREQPVIALPGGRQERIRSLLNIRRHMHFGDSEWNEQGIPAGPVWIRVDLKTQILSVFRSGHEIGSAVILYGTDGHVTPTGAFVIREKKQDGWSRSYDAPMRYMLRLTDTGVAIHASEVERGYATHGCIGIPPGFARRLFAVAKQGDAVAILSANTVTASSNGSQSHNNHG
jgi:hypothetical protein